MGQHIGWLLFGCCWVANARLVTINKLMHKMQEKREQKCTRGCRCRSKAQIGKNQRNIFAASFVVTHSSLFLTFSFGWLYFDDDDGDSGDDDANLHSLPVIMLKVQLKAQWRGASF